MFQSYIYTPAPRLPSFSSLIKLTYFFQAGVRATLNARTSILAAANPIGGRYDRAKSLQQNVALSAPIMSRFDLFFILIDETSEMVDYAIARKIVDLHCNKEETYDCVYSREDLLRYIAFSRSFKPIITEVGSKCFLIVNMLCFFLLFVIPLKY